MLLILLENRRRRVLNEIVVERGRLDLEDVLVGRQEGRERVQRRRERGLQ